MLAAGWIAASAACVFQSGGIPLPATDAPRGDRPSVDQPVRLDLADSLPDYPVAPGDSTRDTRQADQRPDSLPKDSKPPDSKINKPVGAAELLAAWNGAQVKCIDDTGAWDNTYIKILDNSTWVTIVDGAVTLAAAAPDTKLWVGSKPTVTLVFNPNACGTEDAVNGNQWDCAGILIRGATLTGATFLLSPSATTADMDLIYVDCAGAFLYATDFAGPEDAGLQPDHPQLVAVVAALKLGILQAASP